jgi:ubiquinone/menaquinone biosynthesis C-methylase UbiE
MFLERLAKIVGKILSISPYELWVLLEFRLGLRFPNLYEPKLSKLFKPKKGEVVVDVGSYKGYYTLKAARAVGITGKVISIEADTQNFYYLKLGSYD